MIEPVERGGTLTIGDEPYERISGGGVSVIVHWQRRLCRNMQTNLRVRLSTTSKRMRSRVVITKSTR